MKKILTVVGVVLLLTLTACGHKTVDNSERALRYEKGATQGNKFVSCLAPGSSTTTNDSIFRYPNNQREWLMQTGGRGADEKSLSFTSKDGIQMTAEVRTSFRLNTSCKPIKVNGKTYKGGVLEAFHELVGRTRQAYFNEDGTYSQGNGDGGWPYVVQTYIGTQIHRLFRDYGPTYATQPLWLNQAVSSTSKTPADASLAKQVQDNIANAVNSAMEQDLPYFGDFNVQIISISPSAQFRKQYTDRKNAQVAAETAELNKEAQIKEAEAKSEVLKKTVAGYGGIDNYLQYLLVQKGGNPFQPQYVVGSR